MRIFFDLDRFDVLSNACSWHKANRRALFFCFVFVLGACECLELLANTVEGLISDNNSPIRLRWHLFHGYPCNEGLSS